MSDISGLAGGGIIAVVAALVVLVRELTRGARETRSEPLDSATEANVALTVTIDRLAAENQRLFTRVGVLESSLRRRDMQLREYRRRVEHLETELAKLTKEVAAFHEQIAQGP